MSDERGAPDAVVVFDGTCNLCSRAVTFIVDHEAPPPALRFAWLQSGAGARLAGELAIDVRDVDSVVFIEDGRVHVRSDAAIRIARRLRRPWRFLVVVQLVPRPLRDLVYDAIARNRYRWFGRREACTVPSSDITGRFIGD